MNYFMNSDILLGEKLLEVLYILMGLILIYTGVKNLVDKSNPHRYGTGYFWCALGIVIGGGRFIPSLISGILIFSMTIPAILKKLVRGKVNYLLKNICSKCLISWE